MPSRRHSGIASAASRFGRPPRPPRPRRRALAVALLAFVACAEPPSVLIVQLDDTRWDGIDRMPELDRFAQTALVYRESFVSSPVCWSSRMSTLTGRYARDLPPRGKPGRAASVFRKAGEDAETLATWLQAAGYTTGFFGKYLNGYQNDRLGDRYYVPPGWDHWRAFARPQYGGPSGSPYEIVHEDGRARTQSEYSTDWLAAQLREFVAEADRPFLAFWAPYASHGDTPGFSPTPAPRHAGAMDDLPLWRPPAYDFVHPDQPDWQRSIQTVGGENRFGLTDRARRRAYEALLSVDEQLAAILEVLPESTIVVVTSDNGVSWGEHGMFFQTKACPYDVCVRVPLLIRAPSLEPGETSRITLNIDIAPIVMQLAGLELPVAIDGHAAPRHSARYEFLEGLKWIPPWRAVRTRDTLVIEYEGGRTDRYDLHEDPHQIAPIRVR